MFLGHHAAAQPDKLALVMAGSGETWTYAELDAWANQISRLLRDHGLSPGDHMAFSIENQPAFLAVCWGAHYAGLRYTAISTRLTADEMAYIVDDCGAQVFVGSPEVQSAAGLPARCAGVERWLATAPGLPSPYDELEAALAGWSAEPLPGRVAGVDMLYSSGTTGQPKGIVPRAPGIPIDARMYPTGHMGRRLFNMDADTVYLSPAPMYHSAPLRFCMGVQALGGTVVMMERFDAAALLDAVDRHEVTHTQVVPTMFVRLLKLPEDVRARFRGETLTTAIHAAAPCPVEVKRQMMDWWGPIIYEYYGGTENNGFAYCPPDEWLAHPGSVGRAAGCTIRICDDEGNELPAGETGTVYFEGGGDFEYHNDAAKTAGSRHPKGWTTLGDIGRLDEDGYLYLTDRKAYMIIVGGVNVYPQEAENVLTLHPAVADVAVFGIPDDEFGEQVKAVVEPMPGVETGPPLEAELIAYCRERLATVKCPRSVDFRDELPRHPTGKLYKRLLKDEYAGG